MIMVFDTIKFIIIGFLTFIGVGIFAITMPVWALILCFYFMGKHTLESFKV